MAAKVVAIYAPPGFSTLTGEAEQQGVSSIIAASSVANAGSPREDLYELTFATGTLADGTTYRFKLRSSGTIVATSVFKIGTSTYYSDNVDLVAAQPQGSGQYSRTVTVLNNVTSQPITGALITLQSSGAILAWGFTNSSGQLVVWANPGTYTLVVSAFAHATQSASIDVSANQTITINLVPSSTLPPIMPGLCTVTVSCIDGQGVPIPNAHISVNVVDTNAMVDNNLVSRMKGTAIADGNGIGTIVMIQQVSFTAGGTYLLEVKDQTGEATIHKRKVRVPNQSACNAEDLITVI